MINDPKYTLTHFQSWILNANKLTNLSDDDWLKVVAYDAMNTADHCKKELSDVRMTFQTLTSKLSVLEASKAKLSEENKRLSQELDKLKKFVKYDEAQKKV